MKRQIRNILKQIYFKMETKFKKGQEVKQEFGGPIMKVIDFEPELIENIITQWEDEQGTIITGKFMDAVLVPAEDNEI